MVFYFRKGPVNMALQKRYKPASPSASHHLLQDIIQLDQSNFLSDSRFIYSISFSSTIFIKLGFPSSTSLDTFMILYLHTHIAVFYILPDISTESAFALIQSTRCHFSSPIHLADIIFNKRK